jgi:hypothetical protein
MTQRVSRCLTLLGVMLMIASIAHATTLSYTDKLGDLHHALQERCYY